MSRFATFRTLSGLMLAAFALAVPAVSRAQTTYTVIDLGTLGGSTSYGLGINASGQVAGYAYPTGDAVIHAARWTGMVAIDLGTLGGDPSEGYGINASGQVAGYSYLTGSPNYHAVRWTGTVATDLGTLGGTNSEGIGINDSGQVTGFAFTTGNTTSHAVIWNGITATDLGTLGGNGSLGNAINASGQVAGTSYLADNATQHAVRWTGTTATDLGTLGGTYSRGNAINASGQVAGAATTTGDAAPHAVRWTGTTITDLGTLGGPAAFGNGIASDGTVVGLFVLANGNQNAFYTVGNTMIDLNTLLPPNSGWVLQSAQAINDNFQITGYGTINGQTHAFLLQPVVANVSGYLALEGVVSLDAVSSAAPLGTFHVSFRTPGTTTEVYGADATLTTTPHVIGGTYTVSNVPPGTYDVAIKGNKNLRVVLPSQVISGTVSLADVSLPAGDADNDNLVSTGDFNVLVGAFGGIGSVPGSGYDPSADFNFDGKIDSADFNLLVGEFGNAGAP